MFSDPVISTVYQLWLRMCKPVRIGQNLWEARCPGCRSPDRALLVGNGSLVACRSALRCPEWRVMMGLGVRGGDMFKPVPPEELRRLNELPIQRASFEPPKPKQPPTEPPREAAGLLPAATPEAEDNGDRNQPLDKSASPGDPRVSDQTDPADAAAVACSIESGPEMPESTQPSEETSPAESTAGREFDCDAPDAPLGTTTETTPPSTESSGAAEGELRKQISVAALVRHAGLGRTIRGSDGRYYVSASLDSRTTWYALESDDLRRLVVRRHHELTGRAASPSFVANVLETLRARAEISDDSEPVCHRVASHPAGTGYLIDLGDAARRAIEVSRYGWEIVDHGDVNFWRPAGMRALPVPEPRGSIGDLSPFVNIEPADVPLLIAWMTAALRPVGPYPILVLYGEQGSAKTTLARVCRRLIDPHATLLRSFPKSERDLMIAAHHNWLLAFDNLSSLASWQSDALCRLSTGGGFGTREWFTNDREVVIHAQRPIIVDGIDDFVQRADLADRCIFLHLPPIPPSRRRGEEEFWADFHNACPRLLGTLLTAVAAGIRLWPQVKLPALSRMADLDRWGESVWRGLGAPAGTFVNAYNANRKSACERSLEESPVFAALSQALAKAGFVEGTPTEVLAKLTGFLPYRPSMAGGWPRSPVALSRILRRMTPQLRAIGFTVEFRTRHDGRFITVTRTKTR
jgi:hypothetical protein